MATADQLSSELSETMREKAELDEALAKAREDITDLQHEAQEALAQRDGLESRTIFLGIWSEQNEASLIPGARPGKPLG